MSALHSRASLRWMVGVSTMALCLPGVAKAQAAAGLTPPAAEPAQGMAQPTNPTQAARPTTANATQADAPPGSTIVVTGIRASLKASRDIKKNAIGVVDAISAEEMGKFPDTNLAEALQRITGVSIDRSNGEGSFVTVRGFGPEYNLVLLNGRQMPASTLEGCCSAPSSRSFDFANLAAEGIAAVEVYKSGRANLPTGGIGSTINILTPRPLDRPGFRGTISAKAVIDHGFENRKVAPEVSGIISDTFADNHIGILVSGSYQRRKADQADFSAGWREGYSGAENNWGSLAQPGTPLASQITNRPGPTDIYQVPQNGAYDFTSIDRKRINGQAVLQVRPFDNLTGTFDYTYSQNTVKAVENSIGGWFNFNNTTSSWTNGPVAGPIFYSEHFNQNEMKDLAITGAISANRTINRSIGGNLAWHGLGGLRFELDAHHSTAESKPTTPYGSNIALGTAIYGVDTQTINFTTPMPVMSISMYPGSEIAASNIRPAGNAFRNEYMRDRINEVSLRGGYDFDASFIQSIDFGASLTDNAVHSAFGNIQSDSWGGTLSAAQTPDNFFQITPIPPALAGMQGSNDPAILQNYFKIDTVGLINFLESTIHICSQPWSGSAQPGTCLANFTTDRHIRERTVAPYIQSLHTFNLFNNPSHLRLGLRYETTKVIIPSETQTASGVALVSYNEMTIFSGPPKFENFTGQYHFWLPAIDFDVSPLRNVKLRASYSYTITRARYDQLQGGLSVNSPARLNGGSTGQEGNPGLLPYKSKNIDLSAEWYYAPTSYLSVGYFHKTVSNFIGNNTFDSPEFGLKNPGQGAAFQAAVAALGPGADFQTQIMPWIVTHYPTLVYYNAAGTPTGILSAPNDPNLIFTITQPGNTNQVAHLHGFEFALQHSFWNTGFGTILNYTIVRSDTHFNNALEYHATQFAVTGVSDSANAVLYYDKNGIQARVAYNWRAGFLSGFGTDPTYVDPYGQVDANASWEFRKGMTVFVEGINILNASRRVHERAYNAVTFAAPGYARYAVGLRVAFGGGSAPPPRPLPPPPPLPPPAATQACADGSVIAATAVCPAPPPPPPAPAAPERG